MQGKEQQFEVKLPAKITGLVFWGLVLIGLFFAVIILQQIEFGLVEQNNKETLITAYEMEEIFEQYSQPPVIEKASGRIRAKLSERMETYGFHAVRLYEDKETLVMGVINETDDVYDFSLHYFPVASDVLQVVKLKIYYENSEDVIADIRKNFLLSIGIGVFIFGLFLQRVLQKMLSSPFQKMVDTAEKFSKGKEDVRFNEERADEFGYLGKFINNAIDSILSSKNEMVLALERASASEAALVHEKERADVTLYSITDSVITVDINEHIVYLNPAGEKLLACSIDDVLGKKFKNVLNIVEESSGNTVKNLLHECFVTGETVHLPEHSSLISRDSSVISIEASIAPMKSDYGDLMGAVIVIQDVSHTRRLTRQLSYQASHDLLTGLYNRRKFEEYLQEILINVREENRRHALFYIDLDNFKIVNDTCGHVAGDELLKQLPAIFNEVLRSGDITARLGGDEFGIILENCGLEQAATIADKIRQKIKAYRFVWDDKIFEIGVSIGVTAITADNAEMSHVLSSADVACYAAKDSGRNRVHIYEPSDKVVSERYGLMHWTARISKALEDNRFRLYQQPIVAIKNKEKNHFEILLRMIDEDGNIIPPDAFIPSAERYGLMIEIDRWVIREAFRYININNLTDPLRNANDIFAINLSGDSINDVSLLQYILQEKEENNISLENVCFEITETVAISNLSKATIFINELKNYGCQFSLDDFGSGLSSFSYLKNLPVNYLKIDGSFVKNISSDVIDRTMVESIQQVGKVMGLKTIAEHVEDESILTVLEEIGVDYAQGYHLGKPESISES
ncbi:diguanylate cyclase/phosphodiesterase (GGDEF & EAL domains) with PAS/PAC sensor(s) [hydrothermal vent metagenome]|uniref:Diguanylate cyclase/phosphodiesterase (GGDEF & EAL domains) with PAS/PAC sensor(S) n=1 Tax=hydrothermal vent metagenome TaxID=652676 RepID=A0A3B0WMW9_9ZZZZ